MTLSVVIATRGRPRILDKTLEALAAQDARCEEFELVVVLDGPDPETASVLERRARSFPASLQSMERPARGPAAARNAGIERASGEVVLLLGDDTRPRDPTLVRRHAELHAGTAETFAVLGHVAWGSNGPVTPFMRWLEESGVQFDYGRLRAGPVPASRYMYTAHLSLKRETVRSVGGFDERFPEAAMEDIELGVRLEAAGLQLDYHPELVVEHEHPIELGASLERAERFGRSAALFDEIHPGKPHPGVRRVGAAPWALVPPLGRALGLVENLPLPPAARRQAWRVRHFAAYVGGYRSQL